MSPHVLPHVDVSQSVDSDWLLVPSNYLERASSHVEECRVDNEGDEISYSMVYWFPGSKNRKLN